MIVENNDLQFIFNIKDQDGEVVNLTGSNVKLRLKNKNEVKELNCIIQNADNGVVFVDLAKEDILGNETIQGEVEITTIDGNVYTGYDIIKFYVREKVK